MLDSEQSVAKEDKEAEVVKAIQEAQDEAASLEKTSEQATEQTIEQNIELGGDVQSALVGEEKTQTQAEGEPSLTSGEQACSQEDLSSAQESKRPWLILVNAPVDSSAHERLLELLENTKQPVQELILMGPGAKAACSDSVLGARYGEFASKMGLKLLVCGMAARDYGAEGEGLNSNFTVTGFMEILLKVKQAKKAGVKVVVW